MVSDSEPIPKSVAAEGTHSTRQGGDKPPTPLSPTSYRIPAPERTSEYDPALPDYGGYSEYSPSAKSIASRQNRPPWANSTKNRKPPSPSAKSKAGQKQHAISNAANKPKAVLKRREDPLPEETRPTKEARSLEQQWPPAPKAPQRRSPRDKERSKPRDSRRVVRKQKKSSSAREQTFAGK